MKTKRRRFLAALHNFSLFTFTSSLLPTPASHRPTPKVETVHTSSLFLFHSYFLPRSDRTTPTAQSPPVPFACRACALPPPRAFHAPRTVGEGFAGACASRCDRPTADLPSERVALRRISFAILLTSPLHLQPSAATRANTLRHARARRGTLREHTPARPRQHMAFSFHASFPPMHAQLLRNARPNRATARANTSRSPAPGPGLPAPPTRHRTPPTSRPRHPARTLHHPTRKHLAAASQAQPSKGHRQCTSHRVIG